jgi:hypothetical protein
MRSAMVLVIWAFGMWLIIFKLPEIVIDVAAAGCVNGHLAACEFIAR